jgi:hypothetical protein
MSVLHKTELGINAIKVRDRALSPRHRMLLILVNGVKSVGDLSNPMPNPDEARQLLTELFDAGFVHMPIPDKPMVAPVAVEVRNSSQPVEALKVSIKRTTGLLEVLLGPSSEAMCLQLERCNTRDEFVLRVQKLGEVVASVCSKKKAADFVDAALGKASSP